MAARAGGGHRAADVRRARLAAPRSIVILLAIGFLPAVVFSWVFELTPQGLKRDEDVAPEQSIAPQTARRMDRVIIAVLVLALAYFGFDKFVLTARRAAAQAHAMSLPNESKPTAQRQVHRRPALREFERRQEQCLLRRGHSGRDSHAAGEDRRSQSHLAHVDATFQELTRGPAPDRAATRGGEYSRRQRSADQVRVNVQLIKAATDAHLWADIYGRKLTDIFAVESDIAKTIADTLQAKLTGSEKLLLAKKPTANPEAYQLYLQGRFFWNKRTAVDLRKSIEYFHQAIEKDPNYALAYAALAQAWFVSPAYNNSAPNDCFPQAEAAARKAISLDDNSSDAHAALAAVKQLYDFDTPGAIAEFQRAIQLNPNDATAHHWLGNHSFASSGQFDRELLEMKCAQELDPLSLVINTNLGWVYLYAGRLDEGIAQLRKTVEMDGTFYDARYSLREALELKATFLERWRSIKKRSR